jgi:hypothetical protein
MFNMEKWLGHGNIHCKELPKELVSDFAARGESFCLLPDKRKKA